MTRNKLYILILALSLAGYTWILINHLQEENAHEHMTVCMVKNVTGVPCPACGSTRSLMSVMEGNFSEAFYTNPLGIISAFMIVVFPIWVLADLIRRRNSFYNFYTASENLLKNKYLYIPAALLIVLNWIWNINKGL